MNAFSSNVNDVCSKVLRTCELLHCSGGVHVFEGCNSEFD